MKKVKKILAQLNELQKDLTLLKGLISQGQKPQEEKTQWGIIEVGGLKFADANLGEDESYPYGKFYNWDAAMEACPSGWRLPTKEEWVKFCEDTTYKWFGDNEFIKGMKFTDKVTDSSIFLPAMGYNYPFNECEYAYYWSSTPHQAGRDSYCFINSSNGTVSPFAANPRCFSFLIRCIKE